jgi:hypothetical protein
VPSRSLWVSLLLVAGPLAGCAVFDRRPAPPPPAGLSVVAQGYLLLHEIVSQQKHLDKLLLIKIESEEVDAIISEISAYSAEVEDQLIALAKEPPGLKLGQQILPAAFVRARQSSQAEQLKELLGATGKDFERRLLLSVSSPLNQARHLARVMRGAEGAPARQAFWKEVQGRFDDQYGKLMGLLEKRYFS